MRSPEMMVERTTLRCAVLAFLLLLPIAAVADAVRGTTIRVAPIYLSPDATSAKLADVDRGREIIIIDTSNNGTWIHVEANLTEERTVTGWMRKTRPVSATAGAMPHRMRFGCTARSKNCFRSPRWQVKECTARLTFAGR